MSRLSFGRLKFLLVSSNGFCHSFRVHYLFHILLVFTLWAPAVQSEPLAPLPVDEQSKWDAIGRVNIAGFNRRGMCSGTLISARVVLTAAHCVLRANLDPVRISDIVFVAGWTRGTYMGVGDRKR
ncbi:trypsin-like serine protease [Shimia sp.]|uniref:trypsin-like serine peptidase n=1 Tax=Shimia sp. TaxID=1954381 RepID=UPI003297C067